MTAKDVIADEVARIDSDGSDGSKTEADRILAALAAAGFAVVELPDPIAETLDPDLGYVGPQWEADAHLIAADIGRRGVEVLESTDEPMTPNDARTLGASLLAAAAYAERGDLDCHSAAAARAWVERHGDTFRDQNRDLIDQEATR